MRTLPSLFVRASTLLGAFLLLTGAAAAQSEDPPSTLTLDRMDSATRLGIQIGFDKLDDVSISDAFAMRFNPYGQYVFPNRLIGVYGQLPISRLFVDKGDSQTAFGNLDAGAFFLPFHDSSLILRAGFALPTASDSGLKAFVNAFSGYERITDFALIPPDCTFLRLSGSTVRQSGMAFVRLELGLDLPLDEPSGTEATLLRVNIAGGVRTDAVDLSFELANIGNLEADGSISEMFIHTLAFGFRTRGANQFHGGMVFPLDEATRGEIWIFSFGYQRSVD